MGGVVGLWLSRATWLAWFVGLEGLISLGWLRSVECLGMIWGTRWVSIRRF